MSPGSGRVTQNGKVVSQTHMKIIVQINIVVAIRGLITFWSVMEVWHREVQTWTESTWPRSSWSWSTWSSSLGMSSSSTATCSTRPPRTWVTWEDGQWSVPTTQGGISYQVKLPHLLFIFRDNDPVFSHHHPNYHPLTKVDNGAIIRCTNTKSKIDKEYLNPLNDFSVNDKNKEMIVH